MELSDPATWLPLDGLAAGFDAHKAAPTGDLDGQRIALADTGETYAFGAGTVDWQRADAAGTGGYEAFAVDDALYYVQLPEGERATSLVLDLRSGHTLTVETEIGPPQPGRTRVGQRFRPGRLAEAPSGGAPPAPSTALLGRRVVWRYSGQHAYEHVYLSPHWYTWQCLAGPERGLADTDEQTTYELRPGIYLFAWREKVVPCAAVTVADHRDVTRIRSHGALFGLDETGTRPVHFTFGAYGRLLSTTVHPVDLDPARRATPAERGR